MESCRFAAAEGGSKIDVTQTQRAGLWGVVLDPAHGLSVSRTYCFFPDLEHVQGRHEEGTDGGTEQLRISSSSVSYRFGRA